MPLAPGMRPLPWAVVALTLAGCTGGAAPSPPVPAPAPAPTPAPEPAPEPLEPCQGVSLWVDFQGPVESAGLARGALTFETRDPNAGLDFAAPYTIQVPNGGANLDVPGLRPTIGVFVSNLGFSPLGAGFRQTMTIEWLSSLEVRAGTAHCEPVSVSCDLSACSSAR